MRAKRIKISLNPSREDDRRVLDYLFYSDTTNTKAIKTAVLDYLDRRDGARSTDHFLQEVKETIRESVQGLQFAPTEGNSSASASDSAMDFLDALESGDAFEESDPTFSD